MDGRNSELAVPVDEVALTEEINRVYTYIQIVEALKKYGLEDEKNLLLVNSVWQKKNQLFDSLGKETERKMFHDENHTNKTIVFTAWGLKAAKEAGINITAEEAQSLIVAAIAHDWGYLKEEGGTIRSDFSRGHEERSKQQIEDFLQGKAQAGEIARVQGYIDWTKFKKEVVAESTIKSERGLLLRSADFLAGGITIGSNKTYQELVGKLAYEFYEQDRPEPASFELEESASSRISEIAEGITMNDTRDFFPRVQRETQPFVKLLTKLGSRYNFAGVINQRVTDKGPVNGTV